MTDTDQLIATLAADRRPIPSPAARLAWALAAGWVVALGALAAALGSPLDPIAERGAAATAAKLGYPLAVAVIATAAALAAGRPSARFGSRLAWLLVPMLLVLAVAAADVASAPAAELGNRLFGSTYGFCVAAVASASLPAFAIMIWAFRALAPTSLPTAGFLTGLGAGGISAAAYALYCPETSPAFLIMAYTPAMLIPALAGSVAGRMILRW